MPIECRPSGPPEYLERYVFTVWRVLPNHPPQV